MVPRWAKKKSHLRRSNERPSLVLVLGLGRLVSIFPELTLQAGLRTQHLTHRMYPQDMSVSIYRAGSRRHHHRHRHRQTHCFRTQRSMARGMICIYLGTQAEGAEFRKIGTSIQRQSRPRRQVPLFQCVSAAILVLVLLINQNVAPLRYGVMTRATATQVTANHSIRNPGPT